LGRTGKPKYVIYESVVLFVKFKGLKSLFPKSTPGGMTAANDATVLIYFDSVAATLNLFSELVPLACSQVIPSLRNFSMG